jgi:hypothetical protein
MSPSLYQLRVKGHLSASWAEAFYGMKLNCESDGCTSITGELPDQAALYGLLLRLRDLGITLISVNTLDHELELKSEDILNES